MEVHSDLLFPCRYFGQNWADCLKTPFRQSFCFAKIIEWTPRFNIWSPDSRVVCTILQWRLNKCPALRLIAIALDRIFVLATVGSNLAPLGLLISLSGKQITAIPVCVCAGNTHLLLNSSISSPRPMRGFTTEKTKHEYHRTVHRSRLTESLFGREFAVTVIQSQFRFDGDANAQTSNGDHNTKLC